MKKNIVFFANSSVDLMNLYKVLKSNFNIIWIVYHWKVYKFLKKKNVENVYYINLFSKISNNIIIKLIKYFTNFFNIKYNNEYFFKNLKNIEEKYSPAIILTDTGQPLANYKTKSIKISTKHSVCYKKHFLEEVNFKYDYVLLPGDYHEERIKKIHKLENVNTKFKVVGNIKVSQFLKDKNFNRLKFMNNISLDSNRNNVLFAPSWNAHGKNLFRGFRFLPKEYGNQFYVLKKLATQLNLLNCNLIIKLHHASHYYLKKKFFKKLDNEKNCFIFKTEANHDIEESNNIIKVSDIIITDTSGVASTGIFLNKKLIFINPHSHYDWHNSDIEKKLRPGFICSFFDEILDAVKNYINNQDPYNEERKKFVEKIFFNPNKDANIKISETIEEILND